MLLVISSVKKLLEHFMKKTSQTQFRIEKLIRRKDNRLYAIWKDCET